MAPSIFVNFRRADTGTIGPHIDTALRHEFGGQAVFRDQRTLPKGLDYRDQLERAVRKCDLLLAVMGPDWASVRDGAGLRYIDDVDDWVRKEIALALAYKLPVIPVLVDHDQLPNAAELPADIRSLTNHQVVYFRPHQEHIDFPPLFEAIREAVPGLLPAQRDDAGGGRGTDSGNGTTFNVGRIENSSNIFGGSGNTINNGIAPSALASTPGDDNQGRP